MVYEGLAARCNLAKQWSSTNPNKDDKGGRKDGWSLCKTFCHLVLLWIQLMMLFSQFVLCSMNLYLTVYACPVFMFKQPTPSNLIKNKISVKFIKQTNKQQQLT